MQDGSLSSIHVSLDIGCWIQALKQGALLAAQSTILLGRAYNMHCSVCNVEFCSRFYTLRVRPTNSLSKAPASSILYPSTSVTSLALVGSVASVTSGSSSRALLMDTTL